MEPFNCPYCGAEHHIDGAWFYKEITCEKCGEVFVIYISRYTVSKKGTEK